MGNLSAATALLFLALMSSVTACNDTWVCNDLYAPVCAGNGQSFPNLCRALHAAADNSSLDLLPLVAGKCCGRRECQAMGFKPVCATSGAIFRNACEAALAGAEPAHNIDVPSNASEPLNLSCEGLQSVRCTMEFQPVCGESGRTYGNRCTAEAAGECVITEGECA